MAKSVFRRYPVGRLTGYSLIKHSRYEQGPVVTAQFFEPSGASNQGLSPSLFTNSASFFSPTVSPGSVNLTPALFTSGTNAFYAATVALSGGASQDLTPGLFSNSQTFYGPTITTVVGLNQSSRVDNSQSFFVPTVSPGPVALTPSLFSNSQTFYSPTVALSGGPQTLTPSLFTNGNTLFTPTVTPGPVALTPTLLTNSQTFFAPVVAAGAVNLQPARVDNTQTFYTATVTAGSVTLSPTRLNNGQTFFAPAVSTGPVNLAPTLLTNANQFFSATVEIAATYLLTSAQAQRLYQIWLLHGLKAGSPLTVSETQRLAGGLDQAVAQAGGTVTMTTSATPVGTGLDIGLMVDELAALHGLTAPLVVTATSRTAGAISQTIGSAGGITTVARQ